MLKINFDYEFAELSEKGGKHVHLEYSVPSNVQGLDKITFEIDSQDCVRLWKW